MEKIKRSLALLLCAVMVLTVFPVSAFAGENGSRDQLCWRRRKTLEMHRTFSQEDAVYTPAEQEEMYVHDLFYGHPQETTWAIHPPEDLPGLTKDEQDIHDLLLPFIQRIAEKGGSAVYAVPRNSRLMRVSADTPKALIGKLTDIVSSAVRALYYQLPEEFYWSDSRAFTCSMSYMESGSSFQVVSLSIRFRVLEGFRSDEPGLTAKERESTVDNQAVRQAVRARDNALDEAKRIRKMRFDDPITGALREAVDRICQLNTYNYASLEPGYNGPDNTQNLVAVFDGDPRTNVVCAGYAAAFQYLCDHIFPDGEVECFYVTGTAGGAHAWNLVRIDGQSYLVDVTNCDRDQKSGPASNDDYFLRSPRDSRTDTVTAGKTYTVNGLRYTYDADTLALYDKSILTLASGHRHTPGAWQHDDSRHWQVCTGCGDKLNTAAHTFRWIIDREATAARPGERHQECTVCGYARPGVEIPRRTMAAPALSVEVRTDSGDPCLTWTAVPGADRYEVEFSAENGPYEHLFTTGGTRLNHGSAQPGTAYRYRVCALDTKDETGEWSQSKTAVCICAQPQVSLTWRDDGKPVLHWQEIGGADSCEVMYSKDGGRWDRLATVRGTRLSHGSAEMGSTYRYQVIARCANSAGDSRPSDTLTVTVEQRLGVPELTITNDRATGRPYLTWTEVEGADKYEVYRSTAPNGPFDRLFTTGGTHMTNSSATPGMTYYYQVRAVAADGTAGNFCPVTERTCSLEQPDLRLSTRSDGKPVLSWQDVPGARRYEVYCAVNGGDFEHLLSVKGTRMTHGSARSGSTYRYRVKAISANTDANSSWSYYQTITVK